MADFKIEAQERTIIGKKVKTLRAEGLVPITVYGAKIKPVSLQVPYRPLEIALMKAGGTNLIDLDVAGKNHIVLARDVQRNVLKGTIMHVDFVAIDMKTKITTDVPITLINESPAVESREGILLTGTNSVTIETLPSNLLHEIQVDLSKLVSVGDTITVADLNLGADITVLSDPEEMIARVSQTSAARSEMLEGMDADIEMASTSAEPEVISKGKDEDEDDD